MINEQNNNFIYHSLKAGDSKFHLEKSQELGDLWTVDVVTD